MPLGFLSFGRTVEAFYSIDKKKEAERSQWLYDKDVPEVGLELHESGSEVVY